jgi:hypothetical protein
MPRASSKYKAPPVKRRAPPSPPPPKRALVVIEPEPIDLDAVFADVEGAVESEVLEVQPEPEPEPPREPVIQVEFLRGSAAAAWWPCADEEMRPRVLQAARSYLSSISAVSAAFLVDGACELIFIGQVRISPWTARNVFSVVLARGNSAYYAELEEALLAWCRTMGLAAVEVDGVVGSSMFSDWSVFHLADGSHLRRYAL